MNTTKKKPHSPELLAELENVLRNPYAPPDREAMAKGCKQINRMREETRRLTGQLDVAVDLIRDARK
jgi:hypothetical protein